MASWAYLSMGSFPLICQGSEWGCRLGELLQEKDQSLVLCLKIKFQWGVRGSSFPACSGDRQRSLSEDEDQALSRDRSISLGRRERSIV